MATEDFVILHGSVRTQEGLVGKGGTVALELAEAKKMDPHGTSLQLKRLWDAEQKGQKAGEEAKAAALAEAEPKPESKADHDIKPAPAAAKRKHK